MCREEGEILISIINSLITACTTILCAIVTNRNIKSEKQRKESKVDESKLLSQMIDANNQLTVGVATALKNGKANGEVEQGLRAVNEANKNYRDFMETTAIEYIRRD